MGVQGSRFTAETPGTLTPEGGEGASMLCRIPSDLLPMTANLCVALVNSMR